MLLADRGVRLSIADIEEHIRADERRLFMSQMGVDLDDLDLDPTRDDCVAALTKSGSNLFATIHNGDHESRGANLRGEYGEALANVFFVQHGFRVSKASGDWYPYDMIAERHQESYRVQVKTTQANGSGYYRSWFSVSDEFDIACIITEMGDVYVIPRMEMTFENTPRNSKVRRFVLYPVYSTYRVGRFKGFEPVASTVAESVKFIGEIVGV